jgi:hypothetical protein
MQTPRELALHLVEEALTECIVTDIVHGTDEAETYRRVLVALVGAEYGEEYADAHCRWSRGEARPEDYLIFEAVQGD